MTTRPAPSSSVRHVVALLVAAIVAGAGCGGAGSSRDGDASGGEAARAAPTSGATVQLVDVATDNYKASFNEDPSVPERRTWLSSKQLEVDGATWEPDPSTMPKPGGVELVNEVVLVPVGARTSTGGTAHVRVRLARTAEQATFRLGPQEGRWGPLLTIPDRDSLSTSPIQLVLTIEGIHGTDRVTAFDAIELEYRHDPQLAAAPEGDLEHNGPGGRWFVDGEPTETNVEAGWE